MAKSQPKPSSTPIIDQQAMGARISVQAHEHRNFQPILARFDIRCC